MTVEYTRSLSVEGVGPVDVTWTERGEGRTFLLLHGGAGPQSVTRFADSFAARERARVLTPTHPGFAGTVRPEALTSVAGLAATYLALLASQDLTDVTIVGNSIGGWICAEMGLLASPRIHRIVLVNAVGIEVPDHPMADFFSLTMEQVAELSWHESTKFRALIAAAPTAPPEIMAKNRAALALYGRAPAMFDATLGPRLGGITVPTLVIWGESDRIVDPEYGRAYAAAIPGATFQLLRGAGHVPQLETPDALIGPIWDFGGTG